MNAIIEFLKQVEDFYTQSEFIQNLLLPIIGFLSVYFANKNIKLARTASQQGSIIAAKDTQIADLKVQVQQLAAAVEKATVDQAATINHLSSITAQAFLTSNLSPVAKKQLADMFSKLPKQPTAAALPTVAQVIETAKEVIEQPIVQEIKETVLSKIMKV